MAKAILYQDDVTGHAGPARVWKLDPPARIGGIESEFVCIWITSGNKYQNPEVVTVPSTERGACTDISVQRRGGSFTLHETPDTTDYVDGAHYLALQLLGGYSIDRNDDGRT